MYLTRSSQVAVTHLKFLGLEGAALSPPMPVACLYFGSLLPEDDEVPGAVPLLLPPLAFCLNSL